MLEPDTLVPGIIIFLVFLWRFLRTRQLYLTSLRTFTTGSGPVPLDHNDIHGAIQQIFFGRLSIKPSSFFIRAFILALAAFCLLPFKGYQPVLIQLTIILIFLYVLWCIGCGFLLMKKISNKAQV